jgi:hypothetical protein
MYLTAILRVATLTALLGSGFVLAQAPAAHAQPAKKATMSADEKKATSQRCSKEADAKGLHGKARKAFRSKCKLGTT